MQTPVRILRRDIGDIPGARPKLSARDLARRDLIQAAGCRVMALHGRLAITIASLAGALGITPGAIKRFFPDMDSLLAEIMSRHTAEIADAIARIKPAGPDYFARRRAAYLALTRTPAGAPTEAHLLLLQERGLLPPDLLDEVEASRRNLGELLAGQHAVIALDMLEVPGLTPQQIEACLARLTTQATDTPQPRPTVQVVPRKPFRSQIEPDPSQKQSLSGLCVGQAVPHHPAAYAARAGPG